MDGRAGRREAADGVERGDGRGERGPEPAEPPPEEDEEGRRGGGRVGGQAGGWAGGGGWAGQNTTTVGVYPGLLNNYFGRKFSQKRREIAPPQTLQRAIFRVRRWWVNSLSLIPHRRCARHDDRRTKTTITPRAEYGSRLKSSRLTKCGVPPTPLPKAHCTRATTGKTPTRQ